MKQRVFGRSRPSISQELEYRRALQAINHEMQDETEKAIVQFFSSTASDANKPKTVAELFKMLRENWYARYSKRGQEEVVKILNKTDSRTREQIRRKLVQIGWVITPEMKKADKKLMRSIVEEDVKMIKSIPQQYFRQVQAAISKAMYEGGDRAAVYEKIRELNVVSDRRAALITRDQVNRATQTFAISNAKKFGATKGKWIHVSGKYASRASHEKLDGKVFDLEKGLYDSEAGKNVKPGELPNCNCQFAVLMPGFEE